LISSCCYIRQGHWPVVTMAFLDNGQVNSVRYIIAPQIGDVLKKNFEMQNIAPNVNDLPFFDSWRPTGFCFGGEGSGGRECRLKISS
jgi:hypothetical protein